MRMRRFKNARFATYKHHKDYKIKNPKERSVKRYRFTVSEFIGVEMQLLAAPRPFVSAHEEDFGASQ